MKEQNTIPNDSILEKSDLKFEYIDNYNIQLVRAEVDSWEPIVAFFSCSPKWLNGILNLRNKAIKAFKLKSEVIDLTNMKPPFTPGNQCGLFRLYEIDAKESILGEDSYHLDFRMSLQIDSDQRLHITTAIKFNNIFGKIYLAIIKPFHKWIVKTMLKKMASDIDNYSLPRYESFKI